MTPLIIQFVYMWNLHCVYNYLLLLKVQEKLSRNIKQYNLQFIWPCYTQLENNLNQQVGYNRAMRNCTMEKKIC